MRRYRLGKLLCLGLLLTASAVVFAAPGARQLFISDTGTLILPAGQNVTIAPESGFDIHLNPGSGAVMYNTLQVATLADVTLQQVFDGTPETTADERAIDGLSDVDKLCFRGDTLKYCFSEQGGAGQSGWFSRSSGARIPFVLSCPSGGTCRVDGDVDPIVSYAGTAQSATHHGVVNYCEDGGGDDTYACDMTPALNRYVTGGLYFFKPTATANTGAATINFNSLGAKTIKKVAGGITTDLATNDIRVGQVVALQYDGTSMQMQSLLGNAPWAEPISKSLTLLSPTTGDTNKVQLAWPRAVTLTRVACSTDVGTVTIQFDERAEATPNTAGTNSLTASLVCDTNTESTTSFSDASIAARVPHNLQITAVASSPTVVRVHVEAVGQ